MAIAAYSPEWVDAKYNQLANDETKRVAAMFKGRGANFGAEKDILARRLSEIRTKLELEAADKSAGLSETQRQEQQQVSERQRQEQVAQAREERARQDQQEYYRQVRQSQFMQQTPYGQNGQNGHWDLNTGKFVSDVQNKIPEGYELDPTTGNTIRPIRGFQKAGATQTTQTTDPNAPQTFFDVKTKKRYVRDANGNLIEDTFGIGFPSYTPTVAPPGGGGSSFGQQSSASRGFQTVASNPFNSNNRSDDYSQYQRSDDGKYVYMPDSKGNWGWINPNNGKTAFQEGQEVQDFQKANNPYDSDYKGDRPADYKGVDPNSGGSNSGEANSNNEKDWWDQQLQGLPPVRNPQVGGDGNLGDALVKSVTDPYKQIINKEGGNGGGGSSGGTGGATPQPETNYDDGFQRGYNPFRQDYGNTGTMTAATSYRGFQRAYA